MSSRAVNVTILFLVVLELASGLGGFLVGEPDGRWVFWLHRAGGLALVVLLFWKVRIATRSYRRRGLSFGTGLAAVGGVLFLGSLATGLLWTTVGLPSVPVPVFGSWTVLSLHVALSLLLIPPFLAHARLRRPHLRWPHPHQTDALGRRAALRLMVLLAAGLLLWGARGALSALVGTPGLAARRFTGSREEASFAGNLHPVTNWLSDPVPGIPPGDWRLRLHGEVEHDTAFSYEEVLALKTTRDTREATLDCTGGWYTVQRWDGVPMAAMLGRRPSPRRAQRPGPLLDRLRPPLPAPGGGRPPPGDPRRGRGALRRARLPLEARRPGPPRVRLGQVGGRDRGEFRAGVGRASPAVALKGRNLNLSLRIARFAPGGVVPGTRPCQNRRRDREGFSLMIRAKTMFMGT